MYPKLYLDTFWQPRMRPEVFVAMPFSVEFRDRFESVIKPAIEGNSVTGVQLSALRVDLSRSGDSVLTEIMDGIAHSRLVLADVSTVASESGTGMSIRNGNVMYELGLALACRQPSEVLVIRSDGDPLLFDTSTVPHLRIDFQRPVLAMKELRRAIRERLLEQEQVLDARVQLALDTLSHWELTALRWMARESIDDLTRNLLEIHVSASGIGRLLDRRLIKSSGDSKSFAECELTEFGRVIAKAAQAARGGRPG